jgi:hypothetical protein
MICSDGLAIHGPAGPHRMGNVCMSRCARIACGRVAAGRVSSPRPYARDARCHRAPVRAGIPGNERHRERSPWMARPGSRQRAGRVRGAEPMHAMSSPISSSLTSRSNRLRRSVHAPAGAEKQVRVKRLPVESTDGGASLLFRDCPALLRTSIGSGAIQRALSRSCRYVDFPRVHFCIRDDSGSIQDRPSRAGRRPNPRKRLFDAHRVGHPRYGSSPARSAAGAFTQTAWALGLVRPDACRRFRCVACSGTPALTRPAPRRREAVEGGKRPGAITA